MGNGPKITIGSKNPNSGFGNNSSTPGPGNYNVSSQKRPNSGVTMGAKYESKKELNE